MSAPRRPWRYGLLAAGFAALAIAGIAAGVAFDDHHMARLSNLMADLVVAPRVLVIVMVRRAYITGVRDPSRARQLTVMVQAIDDGQAVSGMFEAALRDLEPGSPAARWKRGQVLLTPQSVIWALGTSGRARDLTGAQCTGERQPDPGFADRTLKLPGYYNGENVRVLMMNLNGTSMELAAPARLLEVLRYSLARTAREAR